MQCNSANFDIESIPSKLRANIADKNANILQILLTYKGSFCREKLCVMTNEMTHRQLVNSEYKAET